MGKVRTRILGLEELEQAQKEEQKKRSQEKKAAKGKDTDDTEAEGEKVESQAKKNQSEAPVKKHVIGKKHKEALKKVDSAKTYTLTEAVELLKKIKYAGFDESVELHLNIDKEGLKGEVELPHSTGKTVRIKIVDDAVLESLEKGVIDFDILITHPSFMPKLAKFAKTLGPKGLMPNPKAGTVSTNPEEVAKKFEKGTLRWKAEPKFPLLHQMVGKISMESGKIVDNARAFIQAVGKAHVRAVFIKTTMSPGMKVDIEKM